MWRIVDNDEVTKSMTGSLVVLSFAFLLAAVMYLSFKNGVTNKFWCSYNESEVVRFSSSVGV